MAWYTKADLRYRGRLFEVTERYGVFMSVHMLKGKPLSLSEKDLKRIEKLSLRGETRKNLDAQVRAISNL